MPANTTIGRVRIGQRQSTTIASPNWAVKSNLALGDLNNVSTANVENGYALIYNSVTDRYEMQQVLELNTVSGGTFSNPATTIKLKHSTVTDRPTFLNIAEPGYSYTSNTLFIGTPNSDGVINIGGYYYTKTLDDATNLPTRNTLVKRDSLGSASFNVVTANVIVAEINGNANSATQLRTPFNLSLSGDATGNININGASNVSLNLQLVPTGVNPGEYGGTTQIPVLEISTEGLVTSATNVSVATDLTVSADNGSNTISLLSDVLTIAGGDGIDTEILVDTVNISLDNTVIRTSTPSGNQTITGNLSVVGNVVVTGNTYYVNVTEYKVEDPLIYLASNNYISDVIDIGIVGNYYDGSVQRHAGIVRKFNSNDFYIFTNYDEEFDNNLLNIANPSLTFANMHANLVGGVIFESTLDCGTY
jgi:hypothetical protein